MRDERPQGLLFDLPIQRANSQTTVSVLTPAGRGAVATITVRGDLTILDSPVPPIFQAVNRKKISQQTAGRIAFGKWGAIPELAEDVVVCRHESQVLEIHCHGGTAAVRRIIDDLKRAGCSVVDWPEILKQSIDDLDVECQLTLSRATTWRTAEILHEQSAGVLRNALTDLQHLVESQRDIGAAACNLHSLRSELIDQLNRLLKWSKFGCHLSQPWKVVLTGRPNVGKSSLINALLGYERSIVFDQPGTTRDVVTAETALSGWPITLADTAGLRGTSDELEAAGVAKAKSQLELADVRLVLLDISQPPTDEDFILLQQWPEVIVVAHKCDLPNKWGVRVPSAAIRVSSIDGTGVDLLKERLVNCLVPEVPAPGTPMLVTERQVDLVSRVLEAVQSNDIASALAAIQETFNGPASSARTQSDRVK